MGMGHAVCCGGCQHKMWCVTPRTLDVPGTVSLVSVAQVGEEAETKKYPKQEAAGKGTNVRGWVGEGK